MTLIAIRPLSALAAILAALAAASGAMAQNAACQIARAELAALDRGGGAAQIQRRGDLEKLIAYYHAAGCGSAAIPFLSQRPPQCRQIEMRIGQLQMEGGRGGDGARRAQLAANVERACNPAPAPSSPLTAASRGYDPREDAPSSVIVDGEEQPQQSKPPALGRAMCVRTCDGFYFPLSAAPGGREGADEMCQALCPAAETRAFFLDRGGVDGATDARGARYASLRNAYRFRREVSATCACRQPGQTWSSALRRAEEMMTPGSGDVTITDENRDPTAGLALRPSAGADYRAPRKPAHEQAIDPEPLEFEPEPLPPEPSGLAHMTPRPAPAEKPAAEPATPAGPRKPPRVVGPGINTDVGRPTPILPKAN